MALESVIAGSVVLSVLSIVISSLLVLVLAVKLFGLIKTLRFFYSLPGSSSRNILFGHVRMVPDNGEERFEFGSKRMQDTHGKYSCFWIGPFRPIITVYDPDFAKKVLISSAPKFRRFGSPYNFLKPWIGEGLIVANGQQWARSRRLLTPAFHFDILKDYIEVFNQATDKLFTKLDRLAQTGESFDVCPLLTLCTLEVILKCALGVEDDIQEKGHPYAQAVRSLTEISSQRSRKPAIWPDFLFRMTSVGRKFQKHCNYVHKVAEDIIEKKQKELDKEKGRRRRLDFIDLLLSATDEDGKPMTPLEIRNEVDTFMFAGHDTTATAIPWVLYTLAKHKEYQERVQEEIDSIFEGREKRDVLWQDLSKLEMLSLCNKETMRLYPPVPFIQRELNEDLYFDETKIPAGTAVAIPIMFLHRNAQAWDEPDEFRPERFSPDNRGSFNTFAFLPFSAGSRYEVSLPPNAKSPERQPITVLKAEHGIWLTLKRR